MAFSTSTTVKLYDTDASGYIFYGALCRFTQECFEAFLAHHGLSIDQWVSGGLPALPVRAFRGEYLAPLRVGDQVRVGISSVEISTSSLTASFSVTKVSSGVECATACITHVAIDKTHGAPVPLPELVHKLRMS